MIRREMEAGGRGSTTRKRKNGLRSFFSFKNLGAGARGFPHLVTSEWVVPEGEKGLLTRFRFHDGFGEVSFSVRVFFVPAILFCRFG